MKNASIFSTPATIVAVFFFFSSNLFSQREPVLPYGVYSMEQIKKFALDSTKDAAEFRTALVSVLEPIIKDEFKKQGATFSEKYLSIILDSCFSEEVKLNSGEWDNSGRNKKTRKIEFFPGDDWEGFAWVFRWRTFVVPLLKGNCVNVIKKKGVQKSAPKTQTQKPTPPAPTPTILYVKIVQKAENCWGAPGRVQCHGVYDTGLEQQIPLDHLGDWVGKLTIIPRGSAFDGIPRWNESWWEQVPIEKK